jgi:hypothetical protein
MVEIPLEVLHHHKLKRLDSLNLMEVPLELVRNNSQITVVMDVVASLVFDVEGLIIKRTDALLLMKKLIGTKPLLLSKLERLQKRPGNLILVQTSI